MSARRKTAAAVRKKTGAKTTSRARAPKVNVSAILADLKVEDAIRRDLERIGERDPALATSGLAANALQLAREMDSKSSATSKSMCARALNETMEKLHALAPREEKPDMLDELAKRRSNRRARKAAAS